MKPSDILPPRISSKIFVDEATGCWVWKAYVGRGGGYGQVGIGRKVFASHRVVFEAAKGPIPEGLHIDHLCKNRPRCNPEHLEAVTQRVNNLRSDGITTRCLAKTHCPAGHPYSGANLKIGTCGSRLCVACAKVRNGSAERLAQKREYHKRAYVENPAYRKRCLEAAAAQRERRKSEHKTTNYYNTQEQHT